MPDKRRELDEELIGDQSEEQITGVDEDELDEEDLDDEDVDVEE